ncbi:hypothetical protein Nmel_018250, partial [Mimus melanotis]
RTVSPWVRAGPLGTGVVGWDSRPQQGRRPRLCPLWLRPRLCPASAPARFRWFSPPALSRCFAKSQNTEMERHILDCAGQVAYFLQSRVTASLGAVFGLSTCLSASVREEPEDPLNYFIGGCAAGAVLGVRAHSYLTGSTACLGFGITAALMKIGNKEGWRLTGPPKL